MRLLIELPTWLGDAIMASGAVEKLINQLNPTEVTIFGSFVACELFKEHPKVTKIIVDKTKQGNRFFNVYRLSKELKCDMAISFRKHFFSKLLMFLSSKRYFWQNKQYSGHQIEKYNSFIDDILGKKLKVNPPKLYFKPKTYKKATVGINPGATYGSAKRWYPKEFAKVINALSIKYDIIIFGGPGEEEIANDIEKNLTISNYQNLCGKLSIKELCQYVGGLSLFITNDSGPMHIASACNINTIAIFGPTKYKETSPYNTNYQIITKNLDCAPCMKRECPLKHHNCMKMIKAEDILKGIERLI